MEFLLRIFSYPYQIYSFFQRKVLFDIEPDELVLDVGSGDKPFWRADVIADKDTVDDAQRASGGMLIDHKKIFVEADVEHLPFKDKAFDFVFCAHLLEHVEHPDHAIGELTRVAKRGYIEVPGGIGDIFSPFRVHLWLCDYHDGTLIFYQKSNDKSFQEQVIERFGSYFISDPAFTYMMARHASHYFIRIYWEGSLSYKVIRNKNPYTYQYSSDKVEEKTNAQKWIFNTYRLFYRIMNMFFYRPKHVEIQTLLKNGKTKRRKNT